VCERGIVADDRQAKMMKTLNLIFGLVAGCFLSGCSQPTFANLPEERANTGSTSTFTLTNSGAGPMNNQWYVKTNAPASTNR